MSDRAADSVEFLQWALPRLRMRWAGFRKVRGQVDKRIRRRMAELELGGLDEYRERLGADPREWKVLDTLCRVTITRFWRDRGTWEWLLDEGFAHLAQRARDEGRRTLRAWSAGCASGEEPHSLLLAWSLGGGSELAGLELDVLATDSDELLLERARAGVYPEGALSELPEGWREAAFDEGDEGFVLRPAFRRGLRLERHDLRSEPPTGPFDLVLCRNLAFTYFEPELQHEVLDHLASVTEPGALLVLGGHERPPADVSSFGGFPGAPGPFLTRG